MNSSASNQPSTNMTEGTSQEQLQRQLAASLAEALYLNAADIEIEKSFIDLGLDSIVGVEWLGAVNKRYGIAIPASVVYDYPTVKQLAAFLHSEVSDKENNVQAIADVAMTNHPINGDQTPVAPPATSQDNRTRPLGKRSIASPMRNRFMKPRGIQFEPKYEDQFRKLYFYSSDCSGNFEKDGELSVNYVISVENNICLRDHQVFGEYLLPTDTYIELIYSACKTYFSVEQVSLKNISIINPLLGFPHRENYVRIVFSKHDAGLQFKVKSSVLSDHEDEKVHMQGFIFKNHAYEEKTSRWAAHTGASFVNEVENSSLKNLQKDVSVGDFYSSLQQLSFGNNFALGQLKMPNHGLHFLLDPTLLFAGLTTSMFLGTNQLSKQYEISDDVFIPSAIDTIAINGTLHESTYYCYAEVIQTEKDKVTLYFEIVDSLYRPIVVVESINIQRVSNKVIRQMVAAAQPGRKDHHRLSVSNTKKPETSVDVAIIGMSCRFPQSENVEAFWENLKNGTNCITEVPGNRWKEFGNWYHPDPEHPGTAYHKWGGFIDDIDVFDPLFFGISPNEAEFMDPQQRIFLEECFKVIESAGYAPSSLSDQLCGVYVGCAAGDYGKVLAAKGKDTNGSAFLGTSNSILAARISYHLNLKGPSVAIDTACSSSLMAIHLACESIRNQENKLALAGGIALMVTPGGHILTSQVGMQSKTGRCATFDKAADGTVFSEGCGVVLLKSLPEAIQDNDCILGVIKASGTNQDGKTNGITAPSTISQVELISQVYEKYNIDPRKISYVEAHGTGTAMGDPIEVAALTTAFRKFTSDQHFCAIGSVKSNIGHSSFAAGVSGLIKTLLSLKHKKRVPSIHFENPNPHINFDQSPFLVGTEYQDWQSQGPRLASISSFGFSGTNAHLVVEEYVPSPEEHRTVNMVDPPIYIISLSAKTAAQLEQKAQDLLSFIRKESDQPNVPSGEIDLSAMAYTLQLGRDAMEYRLGFIVNSVDELAEKLQAYIDDKQSVADAYQGQVKRNSHNLDTLIQDEEVRETIVEKLIAGKKLSKLLDLWIKGLDIQWDKLYGNKKPRRISLPTYPFAKERCWIEGLDIEQRVSTVAKIHPLVHSNTSDLDQQRYSTTFSGEEFFFTDHQVRGQKILPGVAYLEMARAAAEDATPVQPDSICTELHNTVWLQPMVGTSNKAVSVDLSVDDQERIDFAIYSTDTDRELMHCQGKASFRVKPPLQKIDIQQLLERTKQHDLDVSGFYSTYAAMGIEYGPAHKAVTALYKGDQSLLAYLSLPSVVEATQYEFLLHPSVMDCALQASLGLMVDLQQPSSGKPSLPFALELLRILSPCTRNMIAWVRYAKDSTSSDKIIKLDIDLCDEEGNICVQMYGFSARQLDGGFDEISQPQNREEFSVGLQSLVPVWNSLSPTLQKRTAPPASTKILLVGSEKTHVDWVQKSFPNAQYLPILPEFTVDSIQEKLSGFSFDQLIWIAPDATHADDHKPFVNDPIVEKQQGVLAVFRIIKALLSLRYTDKGLQWTIITGNTQKVKKGERIRPTHAGIVGLIGSVAKEFPHWNVRLLDVDSLKALTARECLSLDWDQPGNGLVYRQGEWFRQELASMKFTSPENPGYKQKGIYVVIGGAGGLGEVWSRFIIEKYQAKIVWIGRREATAEINNKINSLRQIGDAPWYISADATKLESLKAAWEKIVAAYPVINGVVHSAIVLQDQSMAHMDESTFMSSLSAKVDISVNMDRVFGGQDLDFMLFFSSIISFSKSPGQSNYAAGCTFKDSFAQYLNQQYAYPVKIINWGYWGTKGIVARESYKIIMEQMGIGSIEPEEGMMSLQTLVNSEINQMVLVKTLNAQVLDNFNVSEYVTSYPKDSAAILPDVQKGLEKQHHDKSWATLKKELSNSELERLQTEILASSLLSLGFFKHGMSTMADLSPNKKAAPFYERWLARSIRYLQAQKWLSQELTIRKEVRALDDLWAEWKSKKASWVTNPSREAQVMLLEACLKGLPGILSGKHLATDVMFPNSSMKLVEGIYKDNALADWYNEVLGETLKACIKQKLQDDDTSKIRLLEIGAGTGGTTAKLLPLLQEFAGVITEYCYTDVSKAFLMHAEEYYAPQFPALTTALFDVTQPIASQSVATNHYDLVIAANVLHATPNIRETLRNTKAVLKTDGVLLLNELSAWSLFTHQTFGLLEGWWLNEDTALRMEGSPGITPEKWQQLLTEEGYRSIFFPASQAHTFGQQIIAASSDGLVRQLINKEPIVKKSTPISEQPVPARSVPTKAVPVAADSGESLRQKSIFYFQQLVAKTLKMNPQRLDSSQSLAEYGLDSILVNQLTTRLRKEFPGITSTLFFEVQSVDGLADYLIENNQDELMAILSSSLTGVVPPPRSVSSPASPVISQERKQRGRSRPLSFQITANPPAQQSQSIVDVAIIGLSGRYPKSDNLSEFWSNLANGVNCISEIPEERWHWEEYYDPKRGKPDKMYTKWGGFLNDIDKFDPLFFKISPAEAEGIDPQERLFLETCYHAIEDAGYTPENLDEAHKIGVFAGVMNSRYSPTPSYFSISNRVSYLLNFQGPSMTVDTACSSSLTAIHLALESLYSGMSTCAIAGGVNLIIDPVHYLRLTGMNMLSGDNRCKAFGANADGFIDAEGVGAVILKPVKQAELDGDHIYGVIKGSAVNAGGKTNGYTVPNPRAQATLVADALQRANVPADHISYVEAHGTGTALGDPIEIAALTRAFRKSTDQKQFCAIGSSKSNIGHAESAAGIAALTKVLLQVKHKQLVPSLNAEEINPEIDFSQTPFALQKSLGKWPRPVRKVKGGTQEIPRIAGISSFGAGGANVHIVVQEYLSPAVVKPTMVQPDLPTQVIVPLSAKTTRQIKQKAIDLLAYIRGTDQENPMDLFSVAFTLQTGREAMEERVGFLVSSVDQLAEKLHAFINGEQAIDGFYQGNVKGNKETRALFTGDADLQEAIEKWIITKKLAKLVDLWAKGLDLEWSRLYGDLKPKRMSLPLYPFARERYWVNRTDQERQATTAAVVLHPLLHSNISDLDQQGYSTTFSGEEFFLHDHQVNGEKVLPAVAYLEMARVAVEKAVPNVDASLVLELRNTGWPQPLVVTQNKQINIALLDNGNGQIDYEIYDTEAELEPVYCHGSAVFSSRVEVARLDLPQLRNQMSRGTSVQNSIHTLFAKMGVEYGTSFQGIKTIYIGDHQRLVQLSLPDVVVQEQAAYVLHPSLMDCVFQTAISLIKERHQLTNQPLYPFTVDSVSIVSPCKSEMFAWVRYSQDGDPKSNQDITSLRLDMDLCDEEGSVCIQLRGVLLQQLTITTSDQAGLQPPSDSEESTNQQGLKEQEESENLFFQEHWVEQPISTINSQRGNTQFVIFAEKEFREKIADTNEADRFKNAIFVYQAEHYKKESDHLYTCPFNSERDIQKILNSVSIEPGKSISLVYSWAKDKEEAGVHALFGLFKIIKVSTQPVINVTIVGHYDPLTLKTCWDYSWIGFERSLEVILPTVRVSLLYTDSSAYTSQQILDASQQSGVIWYQDNQRFTLSFTPFELSKAVQKPIIKEYGVYLITGGCGGLGLKFAHYLAEKYHAKLILLGRSAFSSGIQEKIDALKQAGASEALYYSIDIGSHENLNAWAKILPFQLSGVIHAAGIGSVQPFYEKTTDDINEVLYPKTMGTIFMDEALSQHPLDFVCYFSSSSALVGDSGSCDYAVANRFLMAYTYYRNQERPANGKTYVINWPMWQEGGMRVDDPEKLAFYLKSSGLDMLETANGIDLWNRFMQTDQVQALLMVGKPTRIKDMLQRIYEAKVRSQKPTILQSSAPVVSKGWKSEYQELSLEEWVISDLKQHISSMLKIALNKLDSTANLTDYGFDSISIAAFSRQLADYFSLEITPSLFFTYTSVEQLGDYFVQDHLSHMQAFYRQPQADGNNSIDTMTSSKKIEPLVRQRLTHRTSISRTRRSYGAEATDRQEPIAIVGMSGRFPKADTVDQLWRLLAEGESGISEIPLSRWDWRDYFTIPGDSNNTIATNEGGFINGIDEFDPLFFKISPKEAEAMDPAQRLLLMEAYHAIEDAGLDPSSLKGSKMGVFVGMEESQFGLLAGMQGLAHSGIAMISSRLSYHFDVHGPNIATNTACSSGLVALHQAVMSLRQKECETALVAGIALILSPMSYVAMGGMLSKDGQSYSLANNANGMGIGEAIAVMMLKPLSAAVANGDNIYGTIKASGINFDGKTNGITAPNGQMQAALIESIYTNHTIDIKDVTHIVTHATGTKLGDSIEVNALNKAFKKLGMHQPHSDQRMNCAITSCKSNVGHTLAASGLVSVISVLKGMQHQAIPASIGCDQESDYITWKDSPFYVNKSTQEWKRNGKKSYIGGVSAFGRSGTNAHVVIEEYWPSVHAEQTAPIIQHARVIIPLSARNREQLKQRASDLLNFVNIPGHDNHRKDQLKRKAVDLVAMAYTLQVGREAMDERIGFLVSSVEQLAEKLQAYINGHPSIEDFYQGNLKVNQEGLSVIDEDDELKKSIVEELIVNNKHSKLLNLWAKGLKFDWNELYGEIKPRRISLPGYPFAKEKYRINTSRAKQAVSTEVFCHSNPPDQITDPGSVPTGNAPQSAVANGQPFSTAAKTERFLTQLIARQLGVSTKNIDREKSFFELGLESLSITHLIGKTNQLLQESLMPSVVFEYTTIRTLAAFLAQTFSDKIDTAITDEPQPSEVVLSDSLEKPRDSVWDKVMNHALETNNILVPMQTAGEKRPIFAIPGVGGSTLCFQPLSQALGSDQPFYGLQTGGLDGRTPLLNSVKKIAEANVTALKAVQPAGPYTLLGYSYGGVIAFEMAKMLLKQKEKMASLLLLDSICPTLQTEDEVEQIVDLYKNLAQTIGITVTDINTEKLRQITGNNRVEYLYDYTKQYAFDMTKEQFTLLYSVAIANARSFRAYQPTKLPSNVDASLFRAMDAYQDKPEDYGWNQWLRNPVKVYAIKADHFSIVDKDPIQEVAKKMSKMYQPVDSSRSI